MRWIPGTYCPKTSFPLLGTEERGPTSRVRSSVDVRDCPNSAWSGKEFETVLVANSQAKPKINNWSRLTDVATSPEDKN